MVRMVTTGFFEDAGFEVVEAENGAEAVQVFNCRADIQAVVTDVQMPGTPDGIALAMYVRDVCPDCAIVVVSGRMEGRDVDLAPGARFVGKPYRGDSLVSMVREMIAA